MITPQSSALSVRGLEKIYTSSTNERVKVVSGVSFDVEEGAFYTLLGPSGCGKTTTLRCVAGLERPDGGSITLDGKVVSDGAFYVPPYKRSIGMVFQSYAIWPHLSVFENTAFPLRVSKTKISSAELKRRVEEALATVQLAGFEGRLSTQLSGGQQQRLALARALVRRPKLLLLDEPLSNLDAKLREKMRFELSDLQRRLGITTLYVTHDQAEALSMSSCVAVMDSGQIVQQGSPREVYETPRSAFVANFVGASNFIDAKVCTKAGGPHLQTQLGDSLISVTCNRIVSDGEKVILTIRPENVELFSMNDVPPGTPNVFSGTIEQVLFLGDRLDTRVRVGSGILSVWTRASMKLRPQDPVKVVLPSEFCSVI